MKDNLWQSVSLLVLGVVWYLWMQTAANRSPMNIVNEAVANCEFAPPGAYRARPSRRGIRWCQGASIQPSIALMNHMYIHSRDMPATYAGEFGSDVQLVYFPRLELFAFNPQIIERSGEQVICYTGAEDLSKRHAEVKISYTRGFLNGTFLYHQTHTFKLRVGEPEACLIQVAIEIM